jgi:thiol:disulfide interchange protein DsbA
MKYSITMVLFVMALSACAREAPAPAPTTATPPNAASIAAPESASAAAANAQQKLDAAASAQEGADTSAAPDKSETALERLAAVPAEGQLPAGKWVAGKNYQPLVPAQPTNAGPGKVEVVEVFWYGCPHCYALDPYLESWRKNKPSYIEFTRIPVMWGAVHRAHAKLFYTLEALGKLEELHGKVFAEIHEKNDPLFGNSEAETQKLQVAFAKANGISEADFLKAYNSFGVQTNLQKADDLGRRYKVDGVPLVVIDGKYESDVGMAGSQANLIQLINDLAAGERHK